MALFSGPTNQTSNASVLGHARGLDQRAQGGGAQLGPILLGTGSNLGSESARQKSPSEFSLKPQSFK